MSWEQIEKNGIGRGSIRPKAWKEVPCMALNKTGMSFNDQFIEAYGCQEGMLMLVFIDRQGFKIGFRKCDISDGSAVGYKIQARDGDGRRGKTNYMSCQKAIKAFPDRIGYVYRARLNAGERIIEVDLNTAEK